METVTIDCPRCIFTDPTQTGTILDSCPDCHGTGEMVFCKACYDWYYLDTDECILHHGR